LPIDFSSCFLSSLSCVCDCSCFMFLFRLIFSSFDAFFRILAFCSFLRPSLFAFRSYLFLKLKEINFSSKDFSLSSHLPQLSLEFGDLFIIFLQLLGTLMLEKLLEICSLVWFLGLYSSFLKSYVDICFCFRLVCFRDGLRKLAANTVTWVTVWTFWIPIFICGRESRDLRINFLFFNFAEVMTFYWVRLL